MARQRSKPGAVLGHKLVTADVPPDSVPMGDGRHLYSASQRLVINWEACIEDDVVQPGTPPTPPTPPVPVVTP